MKLAISGSRNINDTTYDLIKNCMSYICKNCNIEEIWFGGAKGVDNIALKACLDLNTTKKLVVVIPDTIFEQPDETHENILKANVIIQLKNRILSQNNYLSYKIRNEYMIDNTTSLIAFYNGHSKGTLNAINYALKLNKKVKTFYV